MLRYTKIIILVLACTIFVVSFYFYSVYSRSEVMKISFVDVGQGDGIFIETPSHKHIVVDGGPGNATARYIARGMPVFTKNIDLMIATHPDADHVTGLIPILEKYNVETIVTSPAKSETGVFQTLQSAISDEQLAGAEIHIGNLGDEIDFGDGVKMIVVSPRTEAWHNEDTNDESVTTLLTYGEYSFLLTGDLPSTYEGNVISSGRILKNITVLKAGHHGSKYSSSDAFLHYLKPFYTVISAGKDNRYGHPNGETLARLEKMKTNILSTIDRGTITFETDGRNLVIEEGK